MKKKYIIILSPFIIFIIIWLLSVINKYYWDQKILTMCDEYGGVVIFERVEVKRSSYPNLKFSSNGSVRVPSYRNKSESPFYFDRKTIHLKKGIFNLNLLKIKHSIVRSSDSKKLSESITFIRRGGDLPIGFHPSSFSCENMVINIEDSTFNLK